MINKYRVGQVVWVKSTAIEGVNGSPGTNIECEIQHGAPDGSYFVKLMPSREAFAIIKESDITSPTERCDVIQKSDIDVIFFGNGYFAKPVLEKLVECGYNISAVVTNPAAKQGRNRHSKPTVIAEYANERGLNLLTPLSLSEPQFLNTISKLRPTVGVVVEYGILPKEVYLMPKRGTINLHSSLLPEYRGASTVASAIRDGKPYTGLTTFRLSAGVDTGDIINNLLLPIEDTDNSADVLMRMQAYGPDLVDDAICRLLNDCPLVPQERLIDETTQVSYAPKVFRQDLGINWHQPSQRVYDFIRAYAPTPSAWTDMWVGTIGGESFRNVKIHKASISDYRLDPGMWKATNGHLLIGTADYAISVESLQLPGKRIITASEFCNRFRGNACGYCERRGDMVAN